MHALCQKYLIHTVDFNNMSLLEICGYLHILYSVTSRFLLNTYETSVLFPDLFMMNFYVEAVVFMNMMHFVS